MGKNIILLKDIMENAICRNKIVQALKTYKFYYNSLVYLALS